MNDVKRDTEQQDLSDFHRDFLVRYMEVELKKQELASDRFLRERTHRVDGCDLKSLKKRLRAS